MKYISLFSGIGGFEYTIHKKWKDAECLFFSEIKETAIDVYKHHYPSHNNLGDITNITEESINMILTNKGQCDLLVAGFPCTNLSSFANIKGDNSGLNGKKSKLFYEMLRIIKIVKPKYFIIENNYSMKKSNKTTITNVLKDETKNEIYMTYINSCDFGVQFRKRLFWTNFKINESVKICKQFWFDVLEPPEKILDKNISKKLIECLNKISKKTDNERESMIIISSNKKDRYVFNKIKTFGYTRWEQFKKSDTMDKQFYTYNIGKSKPIIASGAAENIVIDRRTGYDSFIVRNFTINEMERLFCLPENYTYVNKISITKRTELLGNSVVTSVVSYIIDNLFF